MTCTDSDTHIKKIISKQQDRSSSIVEHPEQNIVSKSNKMIYANYLLSLMQQKFILLLASHIQPEDCDFKRYVYTVNDITRGLKLKPSNKNYTLIKKTAEELMDKPALRIIELDSDTGKNKKKLVHWFNTLEYLGNAKIAIEFHKDLKPYLLRLSERLSENGGFSAYELGNVLDLKSKYSIRTYEILKANESKTPAKITYTIEEYRHYIGIENNKYKSFGHLNDRVLKKAECELREHTDIYFEYEPIKEGRRVIAINFHIYPNPKNKMQKETEKLKKPINSTFIPRK